MPMIVFVPLLFSAYLFDCAILTVYFTHMLQLNSYRGERYSGWMREKRREIVAKLGWVILAAVSVGIYPLKSADWRTQAVCTSIFIIHGIMNFPKKAKKPLVYTPRVCRLLTTCVLLALVPAVLTALTGFHRIGVAVMFVWVSVCPFSVMLANLINRPLEQTFARHFINDAKSILRRMNHLIVIGITGSYGKTSVKNFLFTLLSSEYNVLMTPESYNTPLGIVRTIRENLTPSHEIFIAEMGAKNCGDIREICDIVHPKYGIITSIGEQHLETFGTIENIIHTKFELADAISTEGTVFLNIDNAHIAEHTMTGCAVTYGMADGADYKVSDISVDSGGSSFTVTTADGQCCRFSTKLLGTHNIQNIAGCIAAANTLGISLERLVVPVRRLVPVAHRLQLLPNGFIDDAYNSNPAGFRAALDVLSGFDGQRVLVTPGMVELGEKQDELNREIGSYAADKCDYAVLVGEKQAPPLKAGFLDAGFPQERIHVVKNLIDALEAVNRLPDTGGRTVLLENDLPDNF